VTIEEAMSREGSDGLGLLRRFREDNERTRGERLAAARTDADARGKEPFDLGTVERMVDTSTDDGHLSPAAKRRELLEYIYYVDHPSMMTLAELALLLRETRRW
jgi:hypothetical protein